MKVIQEELKKIAESVCNNICKYKEKYSEEEWDQLLEDDELPCTTCPLLDMLG